MSNSVKVTKLSAGHWTVEVFEGSNELGSFNTTDTQLIDDIYELNNDGFESALVDHDTFEEVIESCLWHLQD